MILTNLCLFLRDNNKQVLLGLKKRGFGVGKWDGCGGKVELNESIEEGIIRESKEEFGITPTLIYKIGKMNFHYKNPKNPNIMENHVFISTRWDGEPIESEEMKPKWFDIDKDMPYSQMWGDFEIWFKYLHQNNFNKNIEMDFEFYFDENDKLISYQNNSKIK